MSHCNLQQSWIFVPLKRRTIGGDVKRGRIYLATITLTSVIDDIAARADIFSHYLKTERREKLNFVSFVPGPCLVHYCMKGHECTLTDTGEATCICQRQCNMHRKLICGSDGHIYPNHCELHRAACLTKTAITIERGVHCVKHGM